MKSKKTMLMYLAISAIMISFSNLTKARLDYLDDFADSSIDSNNWTISGTPIESGTIVSCEGTESITSVKKFLYQNVTFVLDDIYDTRPPYTRYTLGKTGLVDADGGSDYILIRNDNQSGGKLAVQVYVNSNLKTLGYLYALGDSSTHDVEVCINWRESELIVQLDDKSTDGIDVRFVEDDPNYIPDCNMNFEHKSSETTVGDAWKIDYFGLIDSGQKEDYALVCDTADDFDDSNIDANLWMTTGSPSETGTLIQFDGSEDISSKSKIYYENFRFGLRNVYDSRNAPTSDYSKYTLGYAGLMKGGDYILVRNDNQGGGTLAVQAYIGGNQKTLGSISIGDTNEHNIDVTILWNHDELVIALDDLATSDIDVTLTETDTNYIPSTPMSFISYGTQTSNGTWDLDFIKGWELEQEDDFNDGSIDSTLWYTTSSPSETGGLLECGGSENIKSKDSFLHDNAQFALKNIYDSRNAPHSDYSKYTLGYAGFIATSGEYILVRNDNQSGGVLVVQVYDGSTLSTLGTLSIGNAAEHDIDVHVNWQADKIEVILDDLATDKIDTIVSTTNYFINAEMQFIHLGSQVLNGTWDIDQVSVNGTVVLDDMLCMPGNAKIELQTTGSTFDGLGKASVRGMQIRNGASTWDIDMEGSSAYNYSSETLRAVKINPEGLSADIAVELSLSETTDYIRWLLESVNDSWNQKNSSGFRYSYVFNSSNRKLHKLIENNAWSMHGSCIGNLFVTQRETYGRPSSHAAILGRDTFLEDWDYPAARDWPESRMASEDNLDYLEIGGYSFARYISEAVMSYKNLYRNSTDTQITCQDQYTMALTYNFVSPWMNVRLYDNAGTNAYIQARQKSRETLLTDASIYLDEPKPTAAVTFDDTTDINDLIGSLKNQGISRVWVWSRWKSNWSEDIGSKISHAITELEWASNMYDVNVLTEFAEKAQKNNIEMVMWIPGGHWSTQSNLRTTYPEWITYNSSLNPYTYVYATNDVGANMYKEGYGTYLLTKIEKRLNEVPFAGVWLDSFQVMGVESVNYNDGNLPTNFEGSLDFVRNLHDNLGLIVMSETASPYTVDSSTSMFTIQDTRNVPWIAYNTNQYNCYRQDPNHQSYSPVTSDEYFELLSYKAPLIINSYEWENYASWANYPNKCYNNVLPYMKKCIKLDKAQGVAWYNDGETLAIVFSKTSDSIDLGQTVQNAIDANSFSSITYSGTTITPGDKKITIVNFQTKPTKACNPICRNGAKSVSVDFELSWQTGVDANSHDVYFGTSLSNVTDANTFSDEFIGNQSGTTYNPLLYPNATYYWRIDEKNTNGTVKGDIWSFTTANYYDDFDDLWINAHLWLTTANPNEVSSLLKCAGSDKIESKDTFKYVNVEFDLKNIYDTRPPYTKYTLGYTGLISSSGNKFILIRNDNQSGGTIAVQIWNGTNLKTLGTLSIGNSAEHDINVTIEWSSSQIQVVLDDLSTQGTDGTFTETNESYLISDKMKFITNCAEAANGTWDVDRVSIE